jgi:hypothetical protein
MCKVNNKKTTKEKDEGLAFATLMGEFEKSKRRAKIYYISASVLVVLAVFSFLLFGPITVPVFSQLGDNILNREEVQLEEVEYVEEVEEEPDEEIVEEDVEEEEPDEEEVVEKNVATTSKPTPDPEPPPETGPDCSEEAILQYASEYCRNNYRLTGRLGELHTDDLTNPLLGTRIEDLEYSKAKLKECNVDAKTYIRNWPSGAKVCVDAMYFYSPLYYKRINEEGLF